MNVQRLVAMANDISNFFGADPDKAAAARALQPLGERQIFGKSIFLFDGTNKPQLAELGEIRQASIADLFVATMKGTYA